MDFRLAPDVNTVLMSFFLNSFRSSGPRIGTHGNFMINMECICKCLVEIIQPTLNKNNKIQNSTSFVHEAKD